MDFLRRFLRDKVSLVLLIVFMVAGIGYFTGADRMGSPLLLIAALYLVYTVNESGKFFERLQELGDKYPGLLHDLGFSKFTQRKRWAEVIVFAFIIFFSIIIIATIIIELTH